MSEKSEGAFEPDRHASQPPPSSVRESITVDGQVVGLILSILEPEEKERVAACIVALAATDAQFIESADRPFVDDVLTRHVEFTLDVQCRGALTPRWWDEVMQRAATAFVRVNGLEGALRRDFQSLGAIDSSQLHRRWN